MSTPDIFAAAVGTCAVAALGWCVWSLICNERTYRDRIKIINMSAANMLYLEYRMVSYDEHMRAYQTLRDPIKLYGPKTRAALSKAPPITLPTPSTSTNSGDE